MSAEEILNQRKNKFLKIGRNKGFISNLENLSDLNAKNNNLINFLNQKKIIFINWIYFNIFVSLIIFL